MSFFKKPKKDGEEQYPSDSAEILSQLKRITDQLSFLEKKMDSLLGRSGGGNRPQFGNRPGGFGNRPPRPQGQGFSGNRGDNRDPRDHYRPNRYDPTRHVRGRRGGQNNGPRRPQSQPQQQSQGFAPSAEGMPQE